MGSALTCLALSSSSSRQPQHHSINTIKHNPRSTWHRRKRNDASFEERFAVEEELSCGTDSPVFKVRERQTGQAYICKAVVKQRMQAKGKSSNNRFGTYVRLCRATR